MTVSLRPTDEGDAWAGEESGVRFEIRPKSGGVGHGEHLREGTEYQVLISGPTEMDSPRLRVGGVEVAEGALWSKDTVAVSNLALGQEFGTLELSFEDGPRRATGRVEVRPRYLDAERDLPAIESDLQRISFSLAYAVWKRTFQELYPDRQTPAGVPEWLGLLRSLWADIRRNVGEIESNPDSRIVRRREVRDAARASKVDAEGIRWLAKTPEAWERRPGQPPGFSIPVSGGFATPTKALIVRNDVSYDTPANRVLKAALRRLERELTRVVRSASRGLSNRHYASGQEDRYWRFLEGVLLELRGFMRAAYMSEVREQDAPAAANVHVVRTDVRYRRVIRALEVLRWGLVTDVSGPAARMSLKDTWQLYEYWVFLYVVDLFGRWGWACRRQGVFGDRSARPGTLSVDMVRGEQSKTQFSKTDPTTGLESVATLFFHYGFGAGFRSGGGEKGQRPSPPGPGALTVRRDVDIFLELQVGSGEVVRVVFDPKYRAEYEGNCLVCPESAIDDMHVYRDAIGRWEMSPGGGRHFRRTLRGAFAVFPSRDESCLAGHRFTKSLDEGVGAVPLLPSEDPPPKMLPSLIARLCGEDGQVGV